MSDSEIKKLFGLAIELRQMANDEDNRRKLVDGEGKEDMYLLGVNEGRAKGLRFAASCLAEFVIAEGLELKKDDLAKLITDNRGYLTSRDNLNKLLSDLKKESSAIKQKIMHSGCAQSTYQINDDYARLVILQRIIDRVEDIIKEDQSNE